MLHLARYPQPGAPGDGGEAAVLLWRAWRGLARRRARLGLLLAALALAAASAPWPRPGGAPFLLPSVPLAVAAGPGGPAVATADGRVWSLDDAGRRSLGEVTGVPVALAADPAAGRAYVACVGAVTALGRGGAAWRAALPRGETPAALAADAPADRVYAAAIAYDHDRTSGHLLALDARTGRVVADVPVGTRPTGLAVDPRAHRVYVADGPSGTIHVLVGDPPAEAAKIRAGGAPDSLAVDSRAGRLYVTDSVADTLAVFDEATGVARATVALGFRPAEIAVDPGTGRLFVADLGTGAVAVLTGDGAPVAVLRVGARPIGLAADPAGGRLYAADFVDHGVWRIEGRRIWGPAARLLAISTAPASPAAGELATP